jgi:hypothetical protein
MLTNIICTTAEAEQGLLLVLGFRHLADFGVGMLMHQATEECNSSFIHLLRDRRNTISSLDR